MAVMSQDNVIWLWAFQFHVRSSPLHRVPQVRERGLDKSASIYSWHLYNTSKDKPKMILSTRFREIQIVLLGVGKGWRVMV